MGRKRLTDIEYKNNRAGLGHGCHAKPAFVRSRGIDSVVDRRFHHREASRPREEYLGRCFQLKYDAVFGLTIYYLK